MSASTSDIKKELETLKISLDTLTSIYAQPVDIHTHTRQIGPFYQQFAAVDRKHQISNTTQSLEAAIAEVLTRCPTSQKANITRVLNTIRTTMGCDKETQVNLQELFIRTWSLVNKPGNYSNAFDLFIQNLDHNILTGGGCVPGIAARLIQPYTHFVHKMLTNIAQNQPKPPAPLVKPPKPSIQQNTEDKDLAEALRRSQLDMQKQNARKQKDLADPELQRALQLSRSEQNRKPAKPVLSVTEERQLAAILERSKYER